MKRILALLMALIMVFAFAACSADEPSNPDDGTTPPAEDNNQGNTPTADGLTIGEAMVNQMLNAQTVHVEMNMVLNHNQEEWYETLHGTQHYTSSGDATIKIVETMVKTESGIPNFKLEMTARFSDGEGGYDEETEILLLVDGYAYTYDSSSDKYFKDAIYDESAVGMLSSFTELLTSFALTEEEKDVIYEAYGDLVLSFFDIDNLKGTFTLDLKAFYEDFRATIEDLDPATMSLKELINLSLKAADPELTVETICADLKDIAGKKPMELYDELDAAVKEKCGLSIQELYDKIFNDERIFKLIQDGAELLEMPLDENFTEMWNTLKSYKIRDFVSELVAGYEMTDLTMYEIISLFVGGEIPSIDDLFAQVDAILDMKLAEMEQVGGTAMLQAFAQSIEMLKTYLSYLTINSAEMSYEMKLSNVFEIETFNGSINFGFSYSAPSRVEGKNNTLSVSETGTISASYSNEAVAIVAPSADQIREDNSSDGKNPSGGIVDMGTNMGIPDGIQD